MKMKERQIESVRKGEGNRKRDIVGSCGNIFFQK
jgi:hypothetical protein